MNALRFGSRTVPRDRALVMAIVNRTRNSLYAGARVFRAHDVASTRKVVEMVASIQGTRPPTRCLRALA